MAKIKQDGPLTAKQENFARYYVEIGNASEAYRMAYDADNMKQESVWQLASRLLSDVKVMSRVKELQKEYEERSMVNRARVEQVLMDIVNVDPAELYRVNADGRIRVKSPTQLPRHMRNALKKIKNDKGVVSYEFNGKTEAANLLGKWNGWAAPTQIDVNGKVSTGELRIGFNDSDE